MSNADQVVFKEGEKVRYRPGTGTYGYEDMLEADGRVPGIVIGFTATRVRVTFTSRRSFTRAVDYSSLEHERVES